jgi:hypothetical protein
MISFRVSDSVGIFLISSRQWIVFWLRPFYRAPRAQASAFAQAPSWPLKGDFHPVFSETLSAGKPCK